jgi:hypothetical protein
MATEDSEERVDRVISALASIMLAGLVLATAWIFSGGFYWVQGRQKPIPETVAMLGGPLGFWGGVTLLAGVVLATYGLHQSLNYYTSLAIIKVLLKSGHSREAIIRRIERFPISAPMKRRLLAALGPGRPPPAG